MSSTCQSPSGYIAASAGGNVGAIHRNAVPRAPGASVIATAAATVMPAAPRNARRVRCGHDSSSLIGGSTDLRIPVGVRAAAQPEGQLHGRDNAIFKMLRIG